MGCLAGNLQVATEMQWQSLKAISMPKKYIFIAGLIILVVAGAITWFWYTSRSPLAPPEPAPGSSGSAPVPVPIPGSSPSIPSNSFPVTTQSGGTLNVGNFTATSQPLPGERSNYVLETSDRFSIEYAGIDQSFSISLNQPPFRETQQAAETAFIQKLNIPKERACNLKVIVGIPSWASDAAVGINYGLSWCPFSLPVPEN